MAATADELLASLVVQRQSFEQQMHDADQLINDSADQLCRAVENERQRLLLETAAIHRNTTSELNKVAYLSHGCAYFRQRSLCLQCFDAVCWAAGRASGL